MKVRDSGMPDEKLWVSFFDPETVLGQLGLDKTVVNVAEFGCGYGIFTVPAARLVTGRVHAFDIEPEMIAETRAKVTAAGLCNVQCHLRDFVAEGTGLPDGSVDYVMLFNILHLDLPMLLLEETYRVLTPKGRLGIMHWNYDPATPRGPSMKIRPKPEQCQHWIEKSGFQLLNLRIDLPPYHYGIVAGKP
ncbi:MAG: methyltransferase type 11 [Gammaproteobacteria bacterium RBG_16_51_14]|nr:MAG: methyltransferase type 11 [Gammaproteobacteria bacterium RBG_16_51_14]